jgi:hypothetical protein
MDHFNFIYYGGQSAILMRLKRGFSIYLWGEIFLKINND